MTPILSSTLLRTQSDRRLVALAQQGYERPFETLVERYRRPLQRYCGRIVSSSRAEDAVQQSFLKAWTGIQAGGEVRDFRAWLYRIARNSALDLARERNETFEELDEELRAPPHVEPASIAQRQGELRATLAAVTALPASQRDALLRTAVGGEAVTDVATQWGTSAGAVRQLVYRARASVRAAATAITPGPITAWAASSGPRQHGAELSRIAEVAGGSAGVGSAGLGLKGGSVLAIAVLGSSIAVSRHHRSITSPIRSTAGARAASVGPETRPGAVGMQVASRARGYSGAPGLAGPVRLKVNGHHPGSGAAPAPAASRRPGGGLMPAASERHGATRGGPTSGGQAHRDGSSSGGADSHAGTSGHSDTNGGGTGTHHDGSTGSGPGPDGSSGLVAPSDSGRDVSGRTADDSSDSGHGGGPDSSRQGDQPPIAP